MTSPNESPEPSGDEEKPSLSSNAKFAKRAYRAFEISSEGRRFIEFRLRLPEPSESFPYATLVSICNEWRMGLGLTLYFSTPMVVIIKGENLTDLYEAIANHRLEWMAEFNPAEYEQPKDSAAPYIRGITLYSSRPEVIPPHIKRH